MPKPPNDIMAAVSATLWTPALVWNRYVESADTALRLTAPGPKRMRAAWPGIVRDMGDALGAEEQRHKEAIERGIPGAKGGKVQPRYGWPDGWGKRGAPDGNAIDRMHEVMRWTTRYLGGEANRNFALALQTLSLCAAAPRMRAQDVCKSRGWERRTAYRWKDCATVLVSDGLNRDRVVCLEQPS